MILLDSSLLIDAINNEHAAIQAVSTWKEEGSDVVVSSLVVAEVLRGIPPGRRRGRARSLLEAFLELPFGPRAARRFGTLMHGLDRAGTPIGVIDGMIAATALVEGAAVATTNRREFEQVHGLEVIGPAPSA